MKPPQPADEDQRHTGWNRHTQTASHCETPAIEHAHSMRDTEANKHQAGEQSNPDMDHAPFHAMAVGPK